jgi:hypothetical protein
VQLGERGALIASPPYIGCTSVAINRLVSRIAFIVGATAGCRQTCRQGRPACLGQEVRRTSRRRHPNAARLGDHPGRRAAWLWRREASHIPVARHASGRRVRTDYPSGPDLPYPECIPTIELSRPALWLTGADMEVDLVGLVDDVFDEQPSMRFPSRTGVVVWGAPESGKSAATATMQVDIRR